MASATSSFFFGSRRRATSTWRRKLTAADITALSSSTAPGTATARSRRPRRRRAAGTSAGRIYQTGQKPDKHRKEETGEQETYWVALGLLLIAVVAVLRVRIVEPTLPTRILFQALCTALAEDPIKSVGQPYTRHNVVVAQPCSVERGEGVAWRRRRGRRPRRRTIPA